MIYRTINLKDEYKQLKFDVNLTVLCPSNSDEIDKNRIKPGIIIFPGGGYKFLSEREGEITALRFLGNDFNTFVLKYSISPNTDFPYPMIEGYAAIDYVKKHAEEFNLNVDELYIMGFSAGGHLAASLACYYKDKQFKEYLKLENTDFKVAGCILGYPVITMDDCYTHLGTRQCVTQKDENKLKDFFSIEKHITKDFPRTFVFTFCEDPVVPFKNTEMLIESLKKADVEVEYHFYHGENHGCALADRSVYNDNTNTDYLKEASEWPILAMNFMRR